MLYEAGEHAADLDYLLLAGRNSEWEMIAASAIEFEMVFDFGRGGERDLQKLGEILLGRAAGSLCDVRWNRERRSLKLAYQTRATARWDPLRQPVNVQCHCMRLPPHR